MLPETLKIRRAISDYLDSREGLEHLHEFVAAAFSVACLGGGPDDAMINRVFGLLTDRHAGLLDDNELKDALRPMVTSYAFAWPLMGQPSLVSTGTGVSRIVGGAVLPERMPESKESPIVGMLAENEQVSSLHEGEQKPQPEFRPHNYLDDGTGTACVRCGGREADLCHTSASSSAAPSLRELRELEQKWRDAARLVRESADLVRDPDYKETLRGFATEREDCADQLAALLSGKRT